MGVNYLPIADSFYVVLNHCPKKGKKSWGGDEKQKAKPELIKDGRVYQQGENKGVDDKAGWGAACLWETERRGCPYLGGVLDKGTIISS